MLVGQLITVYSWEGLKLSIGPFQDLQKSRQKCFLLGPWTSRLLSNCGYEGARTVYRVFSISPGRQMGVFPALSLCQ